MLLAVFLAALALILLAVFWVGMPIVNLALLDERRDEPYFYLEFARGAPTDVLQARYVQPLTGLVASEGGVHVGRYRLSHLLEGSRADEWPELNQFHMSRAQTVVPVVTSTPYRAFGRFTHGLVQFRAGQYLQKPPTWASAIAVWLIEEHLQADQDPLATIRQLAQQSTGDVVWDGPIQTLSMGQSWEHMFVVAFANGKQASAWLRSTEVATARKIANAQTRGLSLALYLRQD